jgi:hypothetical protein
MKCMEPVARLWIQIHTNFQWKYLKDKDHVGNLVIDERKILSGLKIRCEV